ncbi:hypothetical protein BDP55DRAFT_626091 [Colletotrichum godetiae]|uniref:Uncharacterized protein n=1 Tax=Colletotrichum godetiae TaxID=1209918 RepID=A0AAJ0AY96_9PEZI|nr:uncharacterized protein BDP55DRAFT_626091 [Colletotrichum godetiae]KAK1700524.1 hypothetical protein BDP55DRAFT_626091 [Colletotrichum godetiae]
MGLEGAIDVAQGNTPFSQVINVGTNRGRQHGNGLRGIDGNGGKEKGGSKSGMTRCICLRDMRGRRTEDTLDFGCDGRGGPVNDISRPVGLEYCKNGIGRGVYDGPDTSNRRMSNGKSAGNCACAKDDDTCLSVLDGRISARKGDLRPDGWKRERAAVKGLKGGCNPWDGDQECRPERRAQADDMQPTKIPLKKDQCTDRRKRDIAWNDRRPVFDDCTDNPDAEHQGKARSNVKNAEVAEFLIGGEKGSGLDADQGLF